MASSAYIIWMALKEIESGKEKRDFLILHCLSLKNQSRIEIVVAVVVVAVIV